MSVAVSHKLSNSLEGALAGGGDPATSPLYVFGPFLKLIVVAGVAEVTFGASVWLVVFTIATVSAMYRLVMSWVTDGSGGSGLTEEEFGGWAVKINAGITFVEYTLTFLVSMAALVTFIADRAPVLNQAIGPLTYRAIAAVALSLLTGWLVNRGPKTAAVIFGPATAGVLLLLWIMNIATVVKFGIHLPDFSLKAFTDGYLHYTLAGYSRILAVMTGIEVFANLVAAYDGTPEERSKKAFGSLLIIMGTAAVTMVITGPAIFRLSDPTNPEVSVFTQTMDKLLPQWLSYAGTLVGVAVLLSACAASAQGLQNLALGLKDRHYIPEILGRRNKFNVADMPVWLEVGIASICFLFIGTSEDIYLSVYAAGVFILLSMTGWAAAKRLIRQLRQEFDLSHMGTFVGTVMAAFLTSAATVIIFAERLKEGAWTYFLFIPVLYVAFTYFRNKLGAPSPVLEELGKLEEAMWTTEALVPSEPETVEILPVVLEPWSASPERIALWRSKKQVPRNILIPLDGSKFAENAIPAGKFLATHYDATVTLLSVCSSDSEAEEKRSYLEGIAKSISAEGLKVAIEVAKGRVCETIGEVARKVSADMLIMTTHGWGGWKGLLRKSRAVEILRSVSIPSVIIRPRNGTVPPPKVDRVLVPLDGSVFSERVLSYVRALDPSFNSTVILLSVPDVPEPGLYGTLADVVARLRRKAESQSRSYLEAIAEVLREDGLKVETVVTGSNPVKTILRVSEEKKVTLIMMSARGRGATSSSSLGGVAVRVLRQVRRPLFLLPIHDESTNAKVR